MRQRLATVLAVAALSFAPRAADAFCRSTTCTGDCPTDEDGCKTTGAKLFWRSSCVGMSLQHAGTLQLPYADVSSVLDASMKTWSEVLCATGAPATIAFARMPDATCRRPQYNADQPNANVVMFRDDDWTYKGIDNTLAFTTVTFDPKTGEIFDADIEVNAAYNHLTVGDQSVIVDLQSILTHELGHAIGLAHSPDPDATMNASYDPGSTSLRDLAPDDVAAACDAYPPDRKTSCAPEPLRGFSADCAAPKAAEPSAAGCNLGRSGTSSFAAGLVVVLGAALRVLRRRGRLGSAPCERALSSPLPRSSPSRARAAPPR